MTSHCNTIGIHCTICCLCVSLMLVERVKFPYLLHTSIMLPSVQAKDNIK